MMARARTRNGNLGVSGSFGAQAGQVAMGWISICSPRSRVRPAGGGSPFAHGQPLCARAGVRRCGGGGGGGGIGGVRWCVVVLVEVVARVGWGGELCRVVVRTEV